MLPEEKWEKGEDLVLPQLFLECKDLDPTLGFGSVALTKLQDGACEGGA